MLTAKQCHRIGQPDNGHKCDQAARPQQEIAEAGQKSQD
jgi:hypothetical protein